MIMKIKKNVITEVMIDDSTMLQVGDEVKFIANKVCYHGIFDGITERGSLKFHDTVAGESIVFNVMPRSIKAIEVKTLEVM